MKYMSSSRSQFGRNMFVLHSSLSSYIDIIANLCIQLNQSIHQSCRIEWVKNLNWTCGKYTQIFGEIFIFVKDHQRRS